MRWTHGLLGLGLLLSSACNSTPEVVLNEGLPPVATTTNSEQNSSSGSTPANDNSSAANDTGSVPTNNSSSPSPENSASPEQPTEEAPSSAAPAELKAVATGDFRDAVHKVSGQVQLLQSGTQKFARLENFSTENGPDLYLYLVKNPTGSPQGDDFVSLGRLRGTQGNANYEIPAEIDLSAFQSVSVWCRAFSVNFGFATLSQGESS